MNTPSDPDSAADLRPAPRPAPVAEPTVQAQADFRVGGQVRHVSGQIYEVLAVHPGHLTLSGVGNPVHPSACTPVSGV